MRTPTEPGRGAPREGHPAARTSRAILLLFASLGVALPGCSGGGSVAAPVEPARAREALATALEGWKKGETIEALKSASPPIVAQDFDWMAGLRLVAYEVEGPGKDDDANLRIPVALTLRTPQGKEVRKKVSYVVGTSPTLTVFRDVP